VVDGAGGLRVGSLLVGITASTFVDTYSFGPPGSTGTPVELRIRLTEDVTTGFESGDVSITREGICPP